MKEIPVTFKSHGKQIVGMMHLPDRKTAPIVIICHGYFGSKTGVFYLFSSIARELCKAGYAILRFDYRGSGDSEGEFNEQRVKTALEDFQNAMKFLSTVENIDTSRVGIIGHSMGGTVAIFSVRRNENIRALVNWATVADYKKLWWDEEQLKEDLEKGYTDRYSFGYKVPIEKITDTFRYNILEEVGRIKIPVMFVHGNKDDGVPFSHSRWLFEKTKSPKELVKIEDADHLFVPQVHREILFKKTISWFKKWLR